MAVDLNNLTSHNILVRKIHMTELLPNILNVMWIKQPTGLYTSERNHKHFVLLWPVQAVRYNEEILVTDIKTDYEPAAKLCRSVRKTHMADKDRPHFISQEFSHRLSLCKLPEMNQEQLI